METMAPRKALGTLTSAPRAQDFTFVCPTEITAFSDKHGEFVKNDCEVFIRRA